jgi:SPP1 gp7 family putative phage head morphogenesis protein
MLATVIKQHRRTQNAKRAKLALNLLRRDPTRTLTLRRAFVRGVDKQFAKLKVALRRIVDTEDYFGLNEPILNTGTSIWMEVPFEHLPGTYTMLLNTFCATGEGGGKDPTCSPSDTGAAQDHQSKASRISESAKKLPGKVYQTIKAKIAVKYQQLEKRYGSKYAKAIIIAAVVATPLPVPGSGFMAAAPVVAMAELHRYVHSVRNELVNNSLTEMTQDEIGRAARELQRELQAEFGHLTTNREDWKFKTSAQKLAAFQAWISTQVKGVRGGDADEIWRKFIERGFKKGAGRAFDDYAKKHPELAGQTGDYYKGSREHFLRTSFAQPVSVEKVKLLAARAFNDLDGITRAMSTDMSRTLVKGFTEQIGAKEMARRLSKDVDIGRSRAERIARTEIIRAHAAGQLGAMKGLGVKELGVQVEYSTAGDDQVCPECADLEGEVYDVDDPEIQDLIPLHPNCRCAWIPAGPALNRRRRWVRNAFCPTGEGGGVDPSYNLALYPVLNRQPVVAVDFDGTIVKERQDDLMDSEVRPGVRSALRQLREAGVYIAIWSANTDYAQIPLFLTIQGVPFDAVNKVPVDQETGSRKIDADLYIDDRSVPAAERDWDDIARETIIRLQGKARQPIGAADGYDELAAMAPQAKRELLELLAPLELPVVDYDALNLGELEDRLMEPGGLIVCAPVKTRERAKEKVEDDYDGDWAKLLDMVRCSVAFDTMPDLEGAIELLRANGAVYARFPKNRFREPDASGYRDYMVNYRLPSGMVVEVQYHVKPMLMARERQHLMYGVIRAIKSSMQEEGREDMTPAERAAIEAAKDQGKDLYAKAWEQIQSRGEVEAALNEFCPGAYRDPTCSPNGAGKAGKSISVGTDSGKIVEVVENPTKSELENYLRNTDGKWLRGVIRDGKPYVWEAIGEADHEQIAKRLWDNERLPWSDRFVVGTKGGVPRQFGFDPPREIEIGRYDPESPNPAIEKWAKRIGVTVNVFCPTGVGGGVDPTCSPGAGAFERKEAALKNVHTLVDSIIEHEKIPDEQMNAQHLQTVLERVHDHLLQNPDEYAALQHRCMSEICKETGERYTISLYDDKHAAIYLLRWGPGQQADWHDHGDVGEGAKVAIRVMKGPVENDFLSSGDKIVRQKLEEGKTYFLPSRYIHRVATGTEKTTWSLHIYSSPTDGLDKMNFYKFDDKNNIILDAHGQPIKTGRWDKEAEAAKKAAVKNVDPSELPDELDPDGGVHEWDEKAGKFVPVQGEEVITVKRDPEQEQGNVERRKYATINSFCPTGTGGGVDPTCSPKGATHAMIHRLRETGGFTFVAGQQKYQNIGQRGYAVSPYPDRSKIFSQKVGLKDVRSFMQDNKDLLSKPGHAVGAWHNPEDGKTYLDVSIVSRSKNDAIKLGREHNQISIFDFKTGSTISTGGTGTQNYSAGLGGDGRGDRNGVEGTLWGLMNVYCPTGEGGGKDPTCSPGGAAAGGISQLNEHQREAIKSQEFKSWFGDYEKDPEHASQAVDKEGQPQIEHPTVMYTGVKAEFQEFKPEFIASDVLYGKGFYFTEDRRIAEAYATHSHRADVATEEEVKAGKVLTCFLNARQPLDLNKQVPDEVAEAALKEFATPGWAEKDFKTEIWGGVISRGTAGTVPGKFGGIQAEDLFDAAKRSDPNNGIDRLTGVIQKVGYDSIVRKDAWAPGTGKIADSKARTWIVFKSQQIKSVDNKGKFSAADPNIFNQLVIDSLTGNVFCATGEGGGVDPTCGRDGGGIEKITGKDYRRLTVDERRELAKLVKQGTAIKRKMEAGTATEEEKKLHEGYRARREEIIKGARARGEPGDPVKPTPKRGPRQPAPETKQPESETKPAEPKPEEKKAETFAPREALRAKVDAGLKDGIDRGVLSKRMAATYRKDVNEVLDRMPNSAVEQMEINKFVFRKTRPALINDLKRLGGGYNPGLGGFYVSAHALDSRPLLQSVEEHNLYVDGPMDQHYGEYTEPHKDAIGVYAHEITHSVDNPTTSLGILGPRKLSSKSEWVTAWNEEINKDTSLAGMIKSGNIGKGLSEKFGPLGRYARKSDSEGLAEFGRLLYAYDHSEKSMAEIEHHFPKCMAFFRANKLWPEKAT